MPKPSAHFIRLELVDAVPLVQYLPEASLIAPKANLILVVPLTPLPTLGHDAAIGVDLSVETAHEPRVEGLFCFDDMSRIVPDFKCHARAQQSARFVVIT